MENLNLIIAENLKKIRDTKKLSLDKVAEMTGVSKSMLGQIERGESNPTITTVWKIANGLNVSFTSLITFPEPDTVILAREDIEPFKEDNGKYRVYPCFSNKDGRPFEVYQIEIEKGGYLNADAHGLGNQEFITIFDGELTVRVGDQEYTIKTGDSIRFRADKPHAYHNSGDSLTRASMVIYYPE